MTTSMLRIRILSRLGLLESVVRLARWSTAPDASIPAAASARNGRFVVYRADAPSR